MTADPDSSRDEPRVDSVGLIGAGRVGQWFVTNLADADYEPVVFDVDPEAVAAAVESGTVAAESPADVADRAKVVVLSLPGRETVEITMEGEDGVLETLGSDQIVLDTGTTPPSLDVRYQSICHERGAGYVDCGITHQGPGEYDDDRGPAYTMFAGGTPEDYEQVRPVIEILSHRHEFFEGIGNGHVVKAANVLRATCLAAIAAEVTEFLTQNGVDPERVVGLLEWNIPGAYFGTEYRSAEGFEHTTNADEHDTGDRGFRVDQQGIHTRMRSSDWAKDPSYALAIAHASNTYVPLLTAAHQTQLAAENYGAAVLDRNLEFNDPDWHHPSRITSVYRAFNRPQEEWDRLSRRGGDEESD
ncbi:NAD(P)-dependent oxidoreductase [Halococcus saccharolyticus]|uniref:Tartronate semialdehyde reductase n=1 Tax=Halococcus saccharolyticus DSM 5350 TaxID=1227455 RepID=M0MME2_9EURY|nr:NAD(P)-binding domain-containing protein [Halococcus saccharolyticus]EMA46513.1 tartronate semialdehyde reductase [Halococcus saccharolyticus DSM 5350]